MFLIAFFLFSAQAHSTSFDPQPFPDQVEEAPILARGQIGNHFVQWVEEKDQTRRIYTYYEFQVTEVFKGHLPDGVKIREIGGIKDGEGMEISGTAKFDQGEDVILTLGSENTDGSYSLRGMIMGKFNLSKNETGQEIIVGAGLNENEPWRLDSLRKLIRTQESKGTEKTSVPKNNSIQKQQTTLDSDIQNQKRSTQYSIWMWLALGLGCVFLFIFLFKILKKK